MVPGRSVYTEAGCGGCGNGCGRDSCFGGVIIGGGCGVGCGCGYGGGGGGREVVVPGRKLLCCWR